MFYIVSANRAKKPRENSFTRSAEFSRLMKGMKSRARLQMLLVMCTSCCHFHASSLQLPSFFDSSMVLQHGEPIHLWGIAAPAVPVAVEYFGALFNSTANERGRWDVQLPARPPSLDATTIVITAAQQQLTLVDVMIGNVLLCSGQSNVCASNLVCIYCVFACVYLHLYSVRTSTARIAGLNDHPFLVDGAWCRGHSQRYSRARCSGLVRTGSSHDAGGTARPPVLQCYYTARQFHCPDTVVSPRTYHPAHRR